MHKSCLAGKWELPQEVKVQRIGLGFPSVQGRWLCRNVSDKWGQKPWVAFWNGLPGFEGEVLSLGYEQAKKQPYPHMEEAAAAWYHLAPPCLPDLISAPVQQVHQQADFTVLPLCLTHRLPSVQNVLILLLPWGQEDLTHPSRPRSVPTSSRKPPLAILKSGQLRE